MTITPIYKKTENGDALYCINFMRKGKVYRTYKFKDLPVNLKKAIENFK